MKRILAVVLLLLMMAAAASASELPKAELTEFDGKRIGVQTGSIEEAKVSETFRDPEITYYAAFPDAIVALQTGKLDAFYAEDNGLRFVAGNAEGLTVLDTGEEGYDIAPIFQKSERGDLLRGQYNAFLKEFRESGKLDEIARKWIDGPEEIRVMDTSALPGENGVITVAVEVGYAPYEYMKDGEVVGFEAELLREFCKAYGYRLDIRNTTFDSIIVGVYTGKFDMGASAFSITEERKRSVNFGDAFGRAGEGILVRLDGGWTGLPLQETTGEKAGFTETVLAGLRRTFAEEDRWKLFASGIGITFLITVLSVLFGTAAGFGLYLLCRNGNKAANALVKAVNWLITGMPLVVFLMVLFYVVFARSTLSGTAVAIIGFTVVFALTVFHLLRSGEDAVSIGQKEAAYALGYSDMDAFMRIILPQAAMHILPSYQGEVISLLKATAVVGYITVMDVTRIGDIIRGRTYDAIFPLLAVVIAYFLLAAVCKAGVRLLARKVNTKNRPRAEIMKGVEIR
ncbi:MAG: ABC transporter substrate-binding protein/permease [Clostridia bacterium]|nr:ABC transporter substrate-binding protein/permease [Clostridia bacterium]